MVVRSPGFVPPGAAARRRVAVVAVLLVLGRLATLGPGASAATTASASAPTANGTPAAGRPGAPPAGPGDAGGPPGSRTGRSPHSGSRGPGQVTGRVNGKAASQATGTAGGAAAGAAPSAPRGAVNDPAGVSAAPSGRPPVALRFPLWPPSVAPPLSVAPGQGLPGLGGTAPQADCRRVKCIALTFDDGPGPYTARLLGMLAAAHVRVTFFLIGGNIRGREAIVRQELAQGNAIGDHTWTHPELSLMSDHAIRSQLARTLVEIKRATGGGTPLMRPPYGATNHRVAAVAREMGFAQILWSVDTNDWRDRNSRIVAHRAVTWAHRNDIILMHDIHPTTVAAVPRILRGLARRGFTFVTVPELFGDRPLRPGGVYFNGPPAPAKKAPAAKAPAAKATAAPATDASPNAAPGGTRPPSA